jgi:predicted Fe-S protein YdhL (DUF1289 family)
MSAGPPASERPAVPSPCTRRCCLDDHDVCLGCGRHLQEIIRWHEAGDEERRAILDAAEVRRQARDQPPGG